MRRCLSPPDWRLPAKRAGTPDEVANVAALLIGPDGGFITGSNFLMDGGANASLVVSYLENRASDAIRFVGELACQEADQYMRSMQPPFASI